MYTPETIKILIPFVSHYQTAFDRLTCSDVPIAGQINKHIKQSQGKLLRPHLTMISAFCCGLPADVEPTHPIFTIAAAIETLHTATLIHDDIIDNSDVRRGIATVNHKWDSKTAVLMGDFYLARVMLALNSVGNDRVTALVNKAVINMSEGELLQHYNIGVIPNNQQTYFDIISKKTASFLSTCCEAGAVIAEADEQQRDALSRFGYYFGMAFQMRDDLLDFMPTSITGKPQGNDLKEHKYTLPVIIALEQADESTKNKILTLLCNNKEITDDTVKKTYDIINECHTIMKTRELINQNIDNAVNEIDILPSSSFKNAMVSLAISMKQ